MDASTETFWHRTDLAAWEKIQAEGVPWGVPRPELSGPLPFREHLTRRTYLSRDRTLVDDLVLLLGDVLLEVKYEVDRRPARDLDNGHVVIAFNPIPISQVRLVDPAQKETGQASEENLAG